MLTERTRDMMSEEASMMRVLQLDRRLLGHRLIKVGIEKNLLFLQPSLDKCVQIWSVNTLYPSSWECIFNLNVSELLYTIPACSYYEQCIYILIVAVFKEEEWPRISIFQIDKKTEEVKEFRLHESSGTTFEDVPLESAVMVCGKDKLYLYDRSMVMGAIPFWDLICVDEHFTISRHDITDEDNEKCSRFPIAIQPELGVFARWRDNHTLAVHYNGKWANYLPCSTTTVDLSHLSTRGLHETYGRAGHRMGAIESPLTFYSDGNTTIAKVTRDHRHFYFEISLNHELQTFTVSCRGSAMYSAGLDRMFYAMVTNKIIAIIGIRGIAINFLNPPSLADISTWSIQQKHTKRDGTGAHSGGLNWDDIWEMCNNIRKSKCIS